MVQSGGLESSPTGLIQILIKSTGRIAFIIIEKSDKIVSKTGGTESSPILGGSVRDMAAAMGLISSIQNQKQEAIEILEIMEKQRHSDPTPGSFGKGKPELMVSMKEGQEEGKHEVVYKINRFLEYRMIMQQVQVKCLNEALTEIESTSKYTSNEGDRNLQKLEDEIVVSQHQNNAEVKTRACKVLKKALKQEAYTQRLAEYSLIFPDVGQNKLKMSNYDDSLMTPDSHYNSVRKYEEAKNKWIQEVESNRAA